MQIVFLNFETLLGFLHIIVVRSLMFAHYYVFEMLSTVRSDYEIDFVVQLLALPTR